MKFVIIFIIFSFSLCKLKHRANTNLTYFYNNYYESINQTITFYFSQDFHCSVRINDTISYKTNLETLDNDTTVMIEHWILHNNVDSIKPIKVVSDDVAIDYYIYNNKINLIDIFFEKGAIYNNSTNISISYIYDAVDLIKSNNHTTNEFIWKTLNENNVHSIKAKFIFDKSVYQNNKTFAVNFGEYESKFKRTRSRKTIVYEGELYNFESKNSTSPLKVLVVTGTMPFVFRECGFESISIVMIIIGSFLLFVIIGIFYVIVSSLIVGELI